MQKKQVKVFAGLLSMSLAVSLVTPLQGAASQAAARGKIALSQKSVTMTVGQKKQFVSKTQKESVSNGVLRKKALRGTKKAESMR